MESQDRRFQGEVTPSAESTSNVGRRRRRADRARYLLAADDSVVDLAVWQSHSQTVGSGIGDLAEPEVHLSKPGQSLQVLQASIRDLCVHETQCLESRCRGQVALRLLEPFCWQQRALAMMQEMADMRPGPGAKPATATRPTGR
jgi:hypothetical protein